MTEPRGSLSWPKLRRRCPPPPRQMWLTMGNAAFDAFIAEVRGPVSA